MQQESSYEKRLWGALISSLVTILLAGWLLPKQPASSMASDWFWSQKAHPEQQYAVVVVGDSRIYRGFSPEDFKATYAPNTALSILNFGFSSAGLDTAFLQAAARLLDTSVATPIIILGITTSSLADENAANKHFWQEYNRTGYECWQRRQLNPKLSFFDPSSANTIRQQLRAEKQGYFQRYYANGWVASDKLPHTPWETYEHVRQTYPQVEFSVEFRLRLIRQIEQWQAKGIQVVAFRPPAAPHLEALEMNAAYYPEKAIKAEIEAVGGIWLDLPDKTYTTYDGNHLVEASAREMSKDLGRLLHARLTQGPRRYTAWKNRAELKKTEPFPDTNRSGEVVLEKVGAGKFSYTFTYNLDQLPFDSLQLTASLWARLPVATQEPITLVISVEDSDGEILLWEGIGLAEQMLQLTSWCPIHFSIPYDHQMEHRILKAYIWNNSRQAVLLDEFTLEIEVYER